MIETAIYTSYSKCQKDISKIFSFDSLLLTSLSVLQSSKFFQELILFCDIKSYLVLVDALSLPFHSVEINLEKFIDCELADIWSLAKIHSYKSVGKPFIHLDSDVVLYKPLPDFLLRGEVCGQSGYLDNLNGVIKSLDYVPKIIKDSYIQYDNQKIYTNAGLCGGNNYRIFNELYQIAREIVEQNESKIKKGDTNFLINQFIEEHCLGILAANQQIPITNLFEELTEEKAVQLGYTHLAGYMKTQSYWKNRVKQKMILSYPKEYNRIKDFCLKHNISV